jgi:hypothetical protein
MKDSYTTLQLFVNLKIERSIEQDHDNDGTMCGEWIMRRVHQSPGK